MELTATSAIATMRVQKAASAARRERFFSRAPSATLFLLLSLVAASFYVSVVLSQSRFVEHGGVFDDLCYMRQAQLFRSHGLLRGLDTDNEGARYILGKASDLHLDGSLSWLPCHNYIPATDKMVMQYPPGTGFLLALFPHEVQTRALYITATTAVFLILCCLIFTARTTAALTMAVVAGCLTLYCMVNPTKASYSMAPTMPMCIVLAFLTVQIFESRAAGRRVLCAAAAGLLLGLAVDVRVSSVPLSAGYAAVFALSFLGPRKLETFLKPATFAAAFTIGVLPTLAANFVNVGDPFATAYGGYAMARPNSFWDNLRSQLVWYSSQTHGVLNWMAITLTFAFVMMRRRLHLRGGNAIVWIIACNLVVNLAFFITHPTASQYYTVPVAMLAIWTLAFAWHASEATRPLNSADDYATWNRALPTWSRALATRAPLPMALLVALGTFWAIPAGGLNTKAAPMGMTFEPRAIIWTHGVNWLSGSAALFQYNLNKHAAAGLDSLDVTAQDAMVAAVAKDNRPQYFIMDDPAMGNLLERAVKFGNVLLVGQVFGYNVFRLNARSAG